VLLPARLAILSVLPENPPAVRAGVDRKTHRCDYPLRREDCVGWLEAGSATMPASEVLRAARLFGFHARTPLRVGLERTIARYSDSICGSLGRRTDGSPACRTTA
jgi:hypothetical protein